eukprot:3385068-Rhodomonas_salina.1
MLRVEDAVSFDTAGVAAGVVAGVAVAELPASCNRWISSALRPPAGDGGGFAQWNLRERLVRLRRDRDKERPG